jgi:hypothetical protein
MEWQPIETAPKDEEIVGAEWQFPTASAVPELHVIRTTYWQDAWRYPSGIDWTPTHWMPLPPTPSPVQQGEVK